jgi:hypothetical protein
MNSSLNYIDRYFQQELVPTEKKEFESRCLSDPAFAQMVAFYISLQDHLQAQWADQKKREFALLEVADPAADPDGFYTNFSPSALELSPASDPATDRPSLRKLPAVESAGSLPLSGERSSAEPVPGKVRRMPLWGKLAVAAAVAGVILFSVPWLAGNKKEQPELARKDQPETPVPLPADRNTATAPVPHPGTTGTKVPAAPKTAEQPVKKLDAAERDRLYARNFKPDAPPAEDRELLAAAFDQYENGSYNNARREFEEAIEVMKNLTGTRTPDSQLEEKEKKRVLFYAHYFKALSYLGEGKPAKAIPELKAIKSSPDGHWQGKKQWYLALAYLKTGEVKQAEALLRQVAANKAAGTYRQKAVKLNKSLNEGTVLSQ